MILEFIKKNKWFILVFSIFLIIITVLFLKINKYNSNNAILSEPVFNLAGDDYVTVKLGKKFIEPGYYAYDKYKNIDTENVITSGNVNIYKTGIYTLTYQYNDIVLIRKVEVIADTTNLKYSINLKGDTNIQLKLNDEYTDPGYYAYDINGNDISKKVEVNGEVNTSKVGIYTILYQLKIDEENVLEKKRIVEVIEVQDETKNPLQIEISVDKTTPTNKVVQASIKVTGDDFLYLVFPNQIVTKSKNAAYAIEKNGTYTFVVYNKNNEITKKTITVSNIDTKKPNGSCEATLNFDNTNIKVNYIDEEITKYVYLDNQKQIYTTTTNNYTHPSKTSKFITVKLFDQAENENIINCKVIDNSYYPAIIPPSDENLTFKQETNTLNVYITKKNSYYITRIWSKNPYLQLNKFDSPEYGKKLYKPSSLLNKAISKYNLTNKLIVAFNASGFYLRDTYDASSVSKYSAYDRTSVGTLVITDGKVIRNAYNKSYKTWFTTGVTPDNKLKIFKDSKATSSTEIENKKVWNQNVINSGIRNTFTFASPLVENGLKSNTTTSMPNASGSVGRQAICQVNDNNFILITGKNLSRSNLINIMLGLKCQTGTNFDGGGSIALLYKDKNSSNIKTVIGDGRSLTEVGYFTE